MTDNTTSLRFIRRDPDKAYISNMLWLPKAKIAERAVKEALQYWIAEKGQPIQQRLWEETEHHLICPREFLSTSQYTNFPFPFIDLTPKTFPMSNVYAKIQIRNAKQYEAYQAFLSAQGGVLNLAPGKGKTVLALKRIADLGCPALIVVHTSYLMEQWKERIASFIEFPLKQTLGIIQGQEFDWKRPITLAMIHSLAERAKNKEIPPEFSKHFGVVMYDEVHHLSAPVFVRTAPLVHGRRYGLTATPTRLDGADFIYKYHLGNVFYTDLEQDLIPRVYFQFTPVWIDLTKKEVLDKAKEINISKLRSYLGQMDSSNEFRAKCLQEALDQGRKVLAISHSKEQLKRLNAMFPGSGLVIQETPASKRTEIVAKSRICFAIDRLGTEGLDDAAIDALFILTPFSSPNDLQQMLGRIQRLSPGKNTPVAIIFDDSNVKPFHYLCNKLRATLNDWRMTYSTLQVPEVR